MAIAFGNTELTELTPKIAVIGVGGAGCNAVNNMITAELQGVDFIVANTDAQALANALADNRIQLGVEITQGLGAGAQPKIGEAAAEEALERIDEILNGCHMAFITAGMGGGTGTGAAPVIARRARERGILTVGVVTKPFQFEGGRRMKIAEAGIQELAGNVDTLIIIPNQNLFRVADEKTTFADAFNIADEVLHSGVRGITDLMVMPGLINLDFADVRTVMSEMGKAMMGTGEAEGEGRAADAAAAAISNPLLEEASLRGAKGVIINVTGGMDMTLYEVDEAVNMVREQVDPDALIVFGSAFNKELEGKLRVSVVATGIEGTGSASLPLPQPVRTKEPLVREDEVAAAALQEDDASETTATDLRETDVSVSVDASLPSMDMGQESEMDVPHFTAEHTSQEEEDISYAAPQQDDMAEREGELSYSEAPTAPVAPASFATETEEEDLEARALRAQGDNPFVAQAPMVPKASLSQPVATPMDEPEGTEAVEMPVEAIAAQAVPEKAEPVPQKRSLFQLVTSGLRGNEAAPVKAPEASNDGGLNRAHAQSQPASQQPAPTTAPSNLGGVSAEDRPAPKANSEQLEIPSFLRRQQN